MGRSTRGTRVITSLKYLPAAIWRIWPGAVRNPSVLIRPAGTTSGRVWTLPPGGHGECPRRNHDDAAGTKWDSSPVERISVNVGTVPVLTPFRAAGAEQGLGSPLTDRVGTGRSRRSTPSRGERGTWGRAAAETRRQGHCDAERSTRERGWPGPRERSWGSGIGNAGQASPLGGGRSRPPVRRPVQPRARPGHAARGVRPGRGEQRPEHSRRGRLDRRRGGTDGRRSRVPGRPAGTGQGRHVPPVAGASTVDPEGPWLGKTQTSGDSEHRRSGGPGRVEAGAGTDLRGRLLPGLLRVPAEPAGPRRDRRDPAVRHPRLPVGAGRRYRGVF